MELKLEHKTQRDETQVVTEGGSIKAPSGVGANMPDLPVPAGMTVLATPEINEDYWLYRVRLNESGQAIVGFPKFGTIGIGFAQEDDWNTNLPHSVNTPALWDHIKHNKGDDSIPDEDCIKAISMIQAAVALDKEAGLLPNGVLG